MEKYKKLFFRYKEQILYLLFGGFTTVVNFVSFYLMDKLLNGRFYILSVVVAWALAVFFAYLTNRVWVFESENSGFKALMKEIGLFLAARIFSLGFDIGIMYVGVSLLLWNKLLTKILSNVVVVLINYVFSKFIIFKKQK